MTPMPTPFYLVSAYLLGSIPFGLLISLSVKKIDVRKHGSGNVGATNVFRVVGKGWGICVLLLDALKGFAAVFFPVLTASVSLDSAFSIACGTCAILGHSFPVWLKFRGGKGVATSLGVFLALAPVPTLISFALFWMVFLIFKIISLSSLIAALVFPLAVALSLRDSPVYFIFLSVSILLAFFVFFKHRSNIKRLLRGEEKKLI